MTTTLTVMWSPGRGHVSARVSDGRATPIGVYRATRAEALRDAVTFATNMQVPLDPFAAALIGAVHDDASGV